ncbi:hypothetical protein EOD42_14915 [Rhodovarius crocodyli]|uniref:Squalene/phytoene synthase family protein n=1 Tax=Rhodovarius crocodyli TaxID=1979269 RepID=A0A437MCX7_9PROT|nr:squalene/phytoene synthase family protein [Rhodovarius crocodyli]RVT95501.1 hypothetical protein EOD42_14915 [Rhodovarius crocodyli]
MAESLSPLGAYVRQHEPERFFTALFAPPEKRDAVFALAGLHHELGRAREVASNPMIAAIRLQWWRDAIEEAAAGKPARKHEVAEPLHAAITAGRLDPADLLAMADAREAELEEEGIPTASAFAAYLRGAHGGLAVATGRLLGASGPDLLALQEYGAAQGLAALLRNLGSLAARGRCLLPLDLLAEAGLTLEEAMADPAALEPVARRLAGDALARLPAPRRWPRPLLAAALPAIAARRDLRRLASGSPLPPGAGSRLPMLWGWLLARA